MEDNKEQKLSELTELIALDAMGGDHAPEQTCKGAVEALKEITSSILLIGDEAKIATELAKYDYEKSRIRILHTSQVVENEDKPVKAIKEKKDSSMVVGMELLKKGDVDALVSAGNTGALLAGGLLKVGRIKGIDRPALASVYPTSKGIAILIDAGANADCKPLNLVQFGMMGSIYANSILGIEKPRVGIVNIGSEEGKGNMLTQDSYVEMKSAPYHFIGNVEARDIPLGAVDVIVCDGFTGNVILKLSEGVVKSFGDLLKDAIMSSGLAKLGGLLIKGALVKMKKRLDYTEYGGAPFLGVNGLLVKAHGSSNSKAFKNAIKYAELCAKNKVVDNIKNTLKQEEVSGKAVDEMSERGIGDTSDRSTDGEGQ